MNHNVKQKELQGSLLILVEDPIENIFLFRNLAQKNNQTTIQLTLGKVHWW